MKPTRGELLSVSPDLILRLQATVGNRAVQRFIARKRSEEQPAAIPPPEPALPPPLIEGYRRFDWITARWRNLRGL